MLCALFVKLFIDLFGVGVWLKGTDEKGRRRRSSSVKARKKVSMKPFPEHVQQCNSREPSAVDELTSVLRATTKGT